MRLLLPMLFFVVSLMTVHKTSAQIPDKSDLAYFNGKEIVYLQGPQTAGILKSASVEESVVSAPLPPDLPSVLIITLNPFSDAQSQDIKSRLLSTGRFSFIDLFDIYYGTPSIEFLRNYDVVMFYQLYHWTDPNVYNPLELAMQQYMDEGGGFVSASQKSIDFHPPGFTLPDAYELFIGGYWSSGGLSLGTVAAPGHPIMAGVSSLTGGYNSSYGFNIIAGTQVLAYWNNATPLVGVKENVGPQAARRVHLNIYPACVSSPTNDPIGWDFGTNGDVLIANALEWAAKANRDCPADITVPVSESCGAVVNFSVKPGMRQVAGLPSGSVFPVGVTGNAFWGEKEGQPFLCSFNVTVVDDESPDIPVCGNVYDIELKQVVARSRTGIFIQYQGQLPQNAIKETITDDCEVKSVTFSKVLFTQADRGMREVTVIAEDASGNISECIVYANVYIGGTRFKSGEIGSLQLSDADSDKELSLQLYPNPTNGKVNLYLTNLNNPEVSVRLFNSTGGMVLDRKIITDGPVELDLTGKVSGLYLLKVNADGNEFNESIILK